MSAETTAFEMLDVVWRQKPNYVSVWEIQAWTQSTLTDDVWAAMQDCIKPGYQLERKITRDKGDCVRAIKIKTEYNQLDMLDG